MRIASPARVAGLALCILDVFTTVPVGRTESPAAVGLADIPVPQTTTVSFGLFETRKRCGVVKSALYSFSKRLLPAVRRGTSKSSSRRASIGHSMGDLSFRAAEGRTARDSFKGYSPLKSKGKSQPPGDKVCHKVCDKVHSKNIQTLGAD